jgi:hypothetical protein
LSVRTRPVWWPAALSLCAFSCASSSPQTCLSVGVNYAGSRDGGLVILTAASTIDSGLQFVTGLPAVPPTAGEVGATVCNGAATGDQVLVTAWLDDGGTAAFCSLPLQPACSPPPGAPQTSEVVTQVGERTTNVHLIIYDRDGGS